jgi:hypothetical protein
VRIGLLRQLTVYSKQFHLHLRLWQHLMLLQPSFSQSMVVWMSPFITTLQPERRRIQLVQPPASWICAAMGSLGKHCKTYVRRVPGIFTRWKILRCSGVFWARLRYPCKSLTPICGLSLSHTRFLVFLAALRLCEFKYWRGHTSLGTSAQTICVIATKHGAV